MRYKCLVFDHDDTVVNSTATIHHPCFCDYLALTRPGVSCDLERYFLRNFDPGMMEMCREDYGMDEEELEREVRFWQDYVKHHIPQAYDGIREIMEKHRAAGGSICVISHSMEANIRRDYAANALPEPELIYGWDYPAHQRKPYPWPMEQIMERLSLQPGEILMIDDLKPGYDMARASGVDFAAVGWANDIPAIENFMRRHSDCYFKTVGELSAYLGY